VAAIHAAYRAAVRRTHPDAGGSATDFEDVQEAYELLRDPALPQDLRGRIDAEMAQATAFARAHDAQLEILGPWTQIEGMWSKARALKLIRAGQFGGLSPDDLVELGSDVPHIALKILMHGAGVAIPLR